MLWEFGGFMGGFEEQTPVMSKTLKQYIRCIVRELENLDPNERNNHLCNALGKTSHSVEEIWNGIVQQVGDFWATYNSKQQHHIIDYAKLLASYHLRSTLDSLIDAENLEGTFHFSNLAIKLENFFQEHGFHPPEQGEIIDFLGGFQGIYLGILIDRFNPSEKLGYS
jgi:hypothetical protein